jgi:hypothetical protein
LLPIPSGNGSDPWIRPRNVVVLLIVMLVTGDVLWRYRARLRIRRKRIGLAQVQR